MIPHNQSNKEKPEERIRRSSDPNRTPPSQLETLHVTQGQANDTDSIGAATTTTTTGVTSDLPPDGGLQAWLCVWGTCLIVMNTWGVINSFGVFQSYYAGVLSRPPSDVSWIGSIQVFLLFFIGPLTGRLTDAGLFRVTSITGSVLVILGTLTASLCTKYWQLFLAQGLCVGLGNGCLFCPTIALVSTYFDKRRSLAIAVASCGSGIGGLVYPSLVQQLLPKVGFAWTMRTIGLIQASTLAIAQLCLRRRLAPRKAGAVLEWAAFKEAEYTLYAAGSFLCFWGCYFVFFFIATYARDIRGMSYSDSLHLLLIINSTSVVGRLIPSYYAYRTGTLTIFVPTAGISAAMVFSWVAVSSIGGLYCWATVAGLAIGGIQSMFPAALAALTTNPNKQGSRIGMVFAVVSFGLLTGPPIEGALITAMNGRYMAAQLFAGASLAFGAVLILGAREIRRRKIGLDLWAKV